MHEEFYVKYTINIFSIRVVHVTFCSVSCDDSEQRIFPYHTVRSQGGFEWFERPPPPWKLISTIKVDILWLIKVLIGVKFMKILKISFENQDFWKFEWMCLEIAWLKDFAPNTPGLLGAAQGPQTPCREVRDSRCMSTNPPSGNSCLRAWGVTCDYCW